MLNFRHPLLIEIPDEPDMMEQLMERLEYLGFMSKYGLTPLYPYRLLVSEYYDANHTLPTHILLTDQNFDPDADGPAVQLCGQVELNQAYATLNKIEELEWSKFMDVLSDWILWSR